MGRSLSRDSFVYLGGAICGGGNSDTEIRRMITTGTNAWRNVERVLGDRQLSHKHKGNVFIHIHVQINNRRIFKNNWIRRIVGVNRADKRRLDRLRVEVGVKESFKKKLARNSLKWTGHVERMGDETLAKRSVALKVEEKRN